MLRRAAIASTAASAALAAADSFAARPASRTELGSPDCRSSSPPHRSLRRTAAPTLSPQKLAMGSDGEQGARVYTRLVDDDAFRCVCVCVCGGGARPCHRATAHASTRPPARHM
eukprot:4562268-Prymnesium_polylepis.1